MKTIVDLLEAAETSEQLDQILEQIWFLTMQEPSELPRVPHATVLNWWMAFVAEDKNATAAAYEYVKDMDWESNQQTAVGIWDVNAIAKVEMMSAL
jgi:hypothetical protein